MEIAGKLVAAAKDNKFDVVHRLLVEGANVNERDEWGGTALGYALAAHNEGAVIELLKRGADVNARDNENRTPLFYSVFWLCPVSMVRLCLEHGGDRSIRDIKGNTPLMMAELQDSEIGTKRDDVITLLKTWQRKRWWEKVMPHLKSTQETPMNSTYMVDAEILHAVPFVQATENPEGGADLQQVTSLWEMPEDCAGITLTWGVQVLVRCPLALPELWIKAILRYDGEEVARVIQCVQRQSHCIDARKEFEIWGFTFTANVAVHGTGLYRTSVEFASRQLNPFSAPQVIGGHWITKIS